MALSFEQRLLTSSALGLAVSLFVNVAMRRRKHFDLRGKNALVTGGARGLGLEIGRVLVRKGAHVAIVARDRGEVERALVDLRNHAAAGARVVGETCDLRDAVNVETMIGFVRSSLGPIDVLVNNAGSIEVGPIDTMTVEDVEAAMKLHCYAPLRMMLAVRAEMKARGGGRIANIASIGGLVAMPHMLPYSASKHALVGLSRGMRAELAKDGVFVSTIAPGLMRTGSPRNALFRGDHEKEHAWFSIADSLPILSMGSARAAARIVRALERGEADVVLGAPAKAAAVASGLAPGLVSKAMSLVNLLLPASSDRTQRRGADSESTAAPSILTTLGDRAALRNNEV